MDGKRAASCNCLFCSAYVFSVLWGRYRTWHRVWCCAVWQWSTSRYQSASCPSSSTSWREHFTWPCRTRLLSVPSQHFPHTFIMQVLVRLEAELGGFTHVLQCRLHRGATLQTVREVQRPAGAVILRVLQKLEQEKSAAVCHPTPWSQRWPGQRSLQVGGEGPQYNSKVVEDDQTDSAP